MQNIDWTRGKTAIFIGSSVCQGCGATNERGWSAMAAERMARNGWTTSNCAIGGQNTADILLRLERDVIAHAPAVCFVGLGLSNEGLAAAENPAVPCGIFLNNLGKIVEALEGARHLPHRGRRLPQQRLHPGKERVAPPRPRRDGYLGRARAAVAGRPGGRQDGHYPAGWENDPWHPNDTGYAHFYEQIPQRVWDKLECPKP